VEISVIIATHRRPDSLARLLAALAPQVRPDRHEIVVAENGTPQSTPLPPLPIAIAHIHDPRPGKCRVQNRAIAAARGAIVACLDDDLVTGADYLAAIESFFATNPGFAAMKGRVLAAEDPLRKVGSSSVYLDLPIVDHGDAITEVRGVLGANMAFRRQVFERLGGFDERLGPGACGHEEDTEFSARIRRAGMHIGYAPDVVVFHEVDPARADRRRYLRVARERGRCRAIHERHSLVRVLTDVAVNVIRVALTRSLPCGLDRRARAEKRLAISLGMIDGLRSSGSGR
jgi:GT2 family glycosyltransferase